MDNAELISIKGYWAEKVYRRILESERARFLQAVVEYAKISPTRLRHVVLTEGKRASDKK